MHCLSAAFCSDDQLSLVAPPLPPPPHSVALARDDVAAVAANDVPERQTNCAPIVIASLSKATLSTPA